MSVAHFGVDGTHAHHRAWERARLGCLEDLVERRGGEGPVEPPLKLSLVVAAVDSVAMVVVEHETARLQHLHEELDLALDLILALDLVEARGLFGLCACSTAR